MAIFVSSKFNVQSRKALLLVINEKVVILAKTTEENNYLSEAGFSVLN
jgi:hypothetical protein